MKALLVLEDGFTLEGKSFTGDFETGGEVIFTTGMGKIDGFGIALRVWLFFTQ